MNPQPAPIPGGEPVTPAAREWFIRSSVRQHHKGLGKYPTELTTFNGRDALEDAAQEGADLWHYLTQARLERDEVYAALFRWLRCRDVYGSIKADDPAGVAEAAAGLQDATDNLERVARRCVAAPAPAERER